MLLKMRPSRSLLRASRCRQVSAIRLPYLTQRRNLHKDDSTNRSSSKPATDFAFVFDIDGVLLRSAHPLPRAQQALSLLQENNIPFILLTNGGGKSEQDRVMQLTELLGVPLSTSQLIQSHTPFGSFVRHKESTIMVLGGPMDGHRCRTVAESYGYKSVITPADVYAAHPNIWPFGHTVSPDHTRPLPKPLATSVEDHLSPSTHLKVSAAFVFNDPRDWGLDTTILLDLLLSHQGYLGTLSPLTDDSSKENRGYQQDGQPELSFSNSDLWWTADWHNPRLGQGGFQAAFQGVWKEVTNGTRLRHHTYGKPGVKTFSLAEETVVRQRRSQLGEQVAGELKLKNVYMIGDNPASDIKGANQHVNKDGIKWSSLLVRSGVYSGGEPAYKPTDTVNDVWEAVQWGLKHSKWDHPA